MPGTVLILHSSAGRYGADLQLLAIAGGLDRARWRAVCVLPERGELAPLLEEAGAEVIVHPLAVLRRALATPARAAALVRAAAVDRRVIGALARERGAGVVHSNTSVILAGGSIARAAGAAHLLHVREIYERAGGRMAAALWPPFRRRLLRADAVACISRAVAAQFPGSERAFVLHDGLPRSPAPLERDHARVMLGVPADRFAVALIGRISDWKGQDVLARALAKPAMSSIGAVGLLAGDPAPGAPQPARRLDRLASELALGERLLRLGFRADIETVLGAADAVVVPSTRPEPLGLVALEAAAAGLPVVASRHGGVVEAVRDGETGRLVAPGDAAALAAALRGLADDPDAGARMGRAGRQHVGERFALDRMLEELQAVYDRLSGPVALRH
ncbi:MAG: glycosyltransferase family 4 protein [Actinomycetota bacterium]|nr:glycosyltransferase family 4 protein [Actinomycetota bacterium]